VRLVKLTVNHLGKPLREIEFDRSLTIVTSSTIGGNKIGKSTALRAINFCLGSNGESIWHDPIKNEDNEQIRSFVTSGGVDFVLELTQEERPIVLRRSFKTQETKAGPRIQRLGWVDGEEYHGRDKYTAALAQLVGHFESKPTYRQIKNRLVKIDGAADFNSLNYLPYGTSNDDYRLIYSNMFAFSGESKVRLELKTKNEIADLDARRVALLDGDRLIDYKRKIDEIDIALGDLYIQEREFRVKEPHNQSVELLRQIRSQVYEHSQAVSSLKVKLDFNSRSLEKYSQKTDRTDIGEIEELYSKAKLHLPGLKKKLEEVVEFHNGIIANKVAFLKTIRSRIETDLNEASSRLDIELDSEKSALASLGNQGYLDDFIILEKEIQSLREQRGRLAYVVSEVEAISASIESKQLGLKDLNKEIGSERGDFEENISLFNTFFEVLTQDLFQLYKNSLRYEIDDNSEIAFYIANGERNTGEGFPRAETVAFDISFAKYCEIRRPIFFHFTIQDSLEAIDEERLEVLIRSAIRLNVQVVISILRDKLTDIIDETIAKHIKLELGENDKFFKLP